MNKQDRETYDKVVELFIDRDSDEKITYTGQGYIANLLAIVKRLDKQLTEVKAAGEPIEAFTARFGLDEPDDLVISVAGVHHTLGSVCLVLGELCRLAQALEEVKR